MYENYKPSNIGWIRDVPAHWELKRLKYVASRSEVKVEADEDSPLPYIGLEHVEPWTGRLLPLDEDLVPSGVSNRFESGDTLFGKLRPYLAKACNVDFQGLCSSELLVLRGKTYDRGFLLYQLLSHGFINLVDSSTYGSKMPRASWDFIGICELPLPPIEEQQTIARFLDAKTAQIDTLVAKKRQLIDKLKEKRSALIARTVTRGLPPEAAKAAGLAPNLEMKDSGVEWLGLIPSHWGIKRLRHIGEAVIGLTYEPGDVSDEEDGTLVLRSSNVQAGKITLDDNVYVKKAIPKHLRTRAGDILICSRNGSRALIGKNAKIDRPSEGMTFGAFMTVFRSEMSEYLYWVFNSDLFAFQSGAFLTSTINQLTVSNLYGFAIALPPAEEQRHICAYLEKEVSALDLLISKVDKAISRLTEYRQALITSAVTGKIDVREAVA